MNNVVTQKQIEQAVEKIVSNRPDGWSNRSVSPYYNERRGKEMKAVLLIMMNTREDQIFEYEHFRRVFHISKHTLYLRVNQSMKYVLEKMDDLEHTLGRFCSMIVVRKEESGVVLRFNEGDRLANIGDFKPKAVVAKGCNPIWRDALDKYLEDVQPGDKPFIMEKLALTADEIQGIKTSLITLPHIMHSITSYSIKVVSPAPEE